MTNECNDVGVDTSPRGTARQRRGDAVNDALQSLGISPVEQLECGSI